MKAAPINSNLKVMGVKIRTIRSQLRMSQEKLARSSGLHRTYISDVERGVRNISLGSLQKLAKALCVPSAVLLQKTPESQRRQPPVILLVEPSAATAEPILTALQAMHLPGRVHRASAAAILEFIIGRGKLPKGASLAGPRLVVFGVEPTSPAGVNLLARMQSDLRIATIPIMLLPDCAA